MRTQLTPASAGPCGSRVTIGAGGTVHIQTALAQQVPASARAVRIDYDPETRCLCFVMLDDPAKGTLTLLRKSLSRERGLRIEARGLLRRAGLLPDSKITVDAAWDASTREVAIVLPSSGPVSGGQAPKLPISGEDAAALTKTTRAEIEHLRRENQQAKALIRELNEQYRRTQDDLAELEASHQEPAGRDTKRAKPLDKAIDFEDRTPDPVTDRGVCETCKWCPGGICCREGSPNVNTRVGAKWTCGFYGYDGHQRWEPHAGDRPDEDDESAEKPAARPKRTVPRVKCPGCGHTLPADKRGVPWSHDQDGRLYRGLSLRWADKKRPCLNSKGGKP